MKLNDAQYISELEKKIAQLEARANKWIGIAHNIADRNGELEESLREEKSEVAQLEAETERLLEHQRAFAATQALGVGTVKIIITWIKATALPHMTGQPMIDKLQAYSKALGGE